MRLSQFLNDPLELLIGLEQIFVDLVHLFSKGQNFAVRFVNQLSSRLEAVFPSLNALYDLLEALVDFLVSLFPLLHFLHFHLAGAVAARGLGVEPARLWPLEQSLPFLRQSFFLPHYLFLELI